MPSKLRQRTLSPNTTFVVVDDSNKLFAPPFCHQQLSKACFRELSRETPGLQILERPAETPAGSFGEAVTVVSREFRWLEMSRSQKSLFSALCEGWASVWPHVRA